MTELTELKDSGTRREFETGAVRDCAEGKGRCDLLPLEVVERFIPDYPERIDRVLACIMEFAGSGEADSLLGAVNEFCNRFKIDKCTVVLNVALQYEAGAKKYGDRNWEKGIPVHCYIDSGIRHYLKYLRGDTDEPHDRAFIWNMFGAIWTAKHYPELNEYPINGAKS